MSRLYKVLSGHGEFCNEGYTKWNLPYQKDDGTWVPGEWMPEARGKLVEYKNGYHLFRVGDLLDWLREAVYEADIGGEFIETEDKVVARRVRLVRRVKLNSQQERLFACWCVRQVWDLLDDCGKYAVETAERYAVGKASEGELYEAWCNSMHNYKNWYAAFAASLASSLRDRVWNAAYYVAMAVAYGTRDEEKEKIMKEVNEYQTRKLIEILESETRHRNQL